MTMKDIINSYLKELSSHICAQLREQDPIYNQSRKKIGKTDDSLQTRVHQPSPLFRHPMRQQRIFVSWFSPQDRFFVPLGLRMAGVFNFVPVPFWGCKTAPRSV